MQLTKDKTIEIKFPSGGTKSVRDITGIELFATGETECPTIRLVYKKKAWHIAASGFTKPPNGELPMRWEDTPHQPVWEMPHEFTSPHAALAVNSPMATFAQSTADAVVQDMMAGLAAQDEKSTTGDKSQSDGKGASASNESNPPFPRKSPQHSRRTPHASPHSPELALLYLKTDVAL